MKYEKSSYIPPTHYSDLQGEGFRLHIGVFKTFHASNCKKNKKLCQSVYSLAVGNLFVDFNTVFEVLIDH